MKRSRSSGATRVEPEIHALLGRTLDRRRLVTGSPATVLGAFAAAPLGAPAPVSAQDSAAPAQTTGGRVVNGLIQRAGLAQ